MTSPLLAIEAKCKGMDPCLFDGDDLFIEVRIKNPIENEVGFPLTYLQGTGPIIRLVDSDTGADSFLKTNLADHDLKAQFTPIAPGKFITVDWIITADELQQFGGEYVDLSAEVTVMAGVEVMGKTVDFKGSSSFQVVSKDKPAGS